MAAIGLLISMYRYRGLTREPQRPTRILTRHDIKLVPRACFYDEAGVAINLTGFTVVYTLRDLASDTLVINRQAASLENQTTLPGQAYYSITALQVANALEGVEEWSITYSAGVTETFPVEREQLVRIRGDVDNA